jgi:hypothetical protein
LVREGEAPGFGEEEALAVGRGRERHRQLGERERERVGNEELTRVSRLYTVICI